VERVSADEPAEAHRGVGCFFRRPGRVRRAHADSAATSGVWPGRGERGRPRGSRFPDRHRVEVTKPDGTTVTMEACLPGNLDDTAG